MTKKKALIQKLNPIVENPEKLEKFLLENSDL